MISSGVSNDNMYGRRGRKSLPPSGINITKSFLFLCQKEDAPMLSAGTGENQGTIMSKSQQMATGCGKKFLKLMIVELSHEEAQDLSRFKVS